MTTLGKQKTALCRKLRKATAKRDYNLMRELVCKIEAIQEKRNRLINL
jgi:hypothetical protein